MKKGPYGGSGRPHTVEHVRTKSYGDDKVFRVAYAHDVAGFVGWEVRCTCVDTERSLSVELYGIGSWRLHSAIRIFSFTP